MKEMHPIPVVKKIVSLVLAIAIGFAFLGLFTYTSQVAFSHEPSPPQLLTAQPTIITATATHTAQPREISKVDDYRTILLLERAADLIVAYEERVRAGGVDPTDTSAMLQYTLLFPIAIEFYNKTAPTPGMESSWTYVIRVATAYAAVYPELQQGRQISTNDMFHLRTYRQLLINYQTRLEATLSNQGFSPSDLSSVQQEVDQIISDAYGSTPVPAVVP